MKTKADINLISKLEVSSVIKVYQGCVPLTNKQSGNDTFQSKLATLIKL